MRPLYGCLAAALTLSLAACTPTPATTPTPVPTTYQCTPEAGGEPYTCTEAQHQDMLKKDALYAEAEQVYRAYYAGTQHTFEQGSPPSEELLSYVTGEAIDIVKETHADGIRAVRGTPILHWVKRAPGVSKQGSKVALETCSDTSAVTFSANGEPDWNGIVSQETVYLASTPSGLKLNYIEFKEVESCE